MSQIVCQVGVTADQISFIWSDGVGAFEPYQLKGTTFALLRRRANAAREELRHLVADSLPRMDAGSRSQQEMDIRQDCLALARCGYELHQSIFHPGAEQNRVARDVLEWLAWLESNGEVDSFEFVLDGDRLIPWNIVYDRAPADAAFLSGEAATWNPFWGIRYNLAAGRKVNPLRRKPLIDPDRVLFVIDPDIRDGLSSEQRMRLVNFATERSFQTARSKKELEAALQLRRPELMYWFCHATPEALVIAGDEISPADLYDMLTVRCDDGRIGGIAFLNACQTAEAGSMGSFLDALHSFGLSGIIATEEQTIDIFANNFGLDFLDGFLNGGRPVGKLLQSLRGSKLPLGLLYGTYCPPNLRAQRSEKPFNGIDAHFVEPSAVAAEPGRLLGYALSAEPQLLPLPTNPYRSLNYYDRSDRALFVGRNRQVEEFAEILDDPTTRILVLHGESGVGKTSFLRAGVIPFLEDECVGYGFLRDRSGQSVRPEEVLFVRATNDLAGQIGQALHDYSAIPLYYPRPKGPISNSSEVKVDLRDLLAHEINSSIEPAKIAASIRSDPFLVGRILTLFGDKLPFGLVLVIDQCEELFTLADVTDDSYRQTAMRILRGAISSAGDFKLILSLRTEYYGYLIDNLRRGPRRVIGVREYMLTEIIPDQLVAAISLPAMKASIPFSKEIPFDKYNFDWENGLPNEIAGQIFSFTSSRYDSVLPLAQVICTQLWDRVRVRRSNRTITKDDFEAIGGVQGGLRRHIETLIARLFRSRFDQKAFRSLLAKLYRRQPDGSVTSLLVPESKLAKSWQGEMPFDKMLDAAIRGEYRLLRENIARIGQQEKQRYITLGHDALARIVAEWDDERQKQKRERKLVGLAILGAVVAIAMIGLSLIAWRQKAEAKIRQVAAESISVSPKEPELGLLLAAEAYRHAERLGRADLREPKEALLTALEREPRIAAFLPGHSNGVWGAAFSADGKMIASSDGKGRIFLWDAITHRPVGQPLESANRPIELHFVGDGRTLAAISEKNIVTVWDLVGRTVKGRPWQFAEEKKDEFGRFRAVQTSFDRSGETMASFSNGSVYLWDTANGQSKHRPFRLPGVSGSEQVALSADSLWVSAGDFEGRSYLVNVRSGSIQMLPQSRFALVNPKNSWLTEPIDCLAFTADSKTLAVADMGGQIRFFDTLTGREQGRPTRLRNTVPEAMAFAGDLLLVSNSWDGIIDLYDKSKGDWLANSLKGHVQGASLLSVGPDQHHLVSGGQDESLVIWDLEARSHVGTRLQNEGRVWSVAFSPTGRVVASGSPDNKDVMLWDANTGQLLGSLSAKDKNFGDLAFSPDGKLLAASGWSTGITIWNVPQMTEVEPLIPARSNFGASLAFSPDGKVLASGADGGVIQFWNVATHQPAGTIPEQSDLAKHTGSKVTAISFQPSGKVLEAADDDGAVSFWDPALRRTKFSSFYSGEPLSQSVFDKDGGLLAVGSRNVIHLWNLRSGKQFDQPFVGDSSPGYALAFRPDDGLLVSGTEEGTIEVWDLKSQSHFGPSLKAHQGEIRKLSFGPDGTRFVSGSDDKTAIIWDLKPQSWMERAEGMVDRNLTMEEWKRYFGNERYHRTFEGLPAE